MHAGVLTLAICILACGTGAAAQNSTQPFLAPKSCGPRIHLTFEDAFPDFFVIKNLSPAGWSIDSLTINLAPSYGHVIFDTEPGGLGVENSEGFYASRDNGVVKLTAVTPVQDGGQALALKFEGFAAEASFTFLIDLDDTSRISSQGQNYVTFGEMAGTSVQARMKGPSGNLSDIEAVFGQTGEADSGAGGCV